VDRWTKIWSLENGEFDNKKETQRERNKEIKRKKRGVAGKEKLSQCFKIGP